MIGKKEAGLKSVIFNLSVCYVSDRAFTGIIDPKCQLEADTNSDTRKHGTDLP